MKRDRLEFRVNVKDFLDIIHDAWKECYRIGDPLTKYLVLMAYI